MHLWSSKRVLVEEIFNSITHGIGALLCLGGLVYLLIIANGSEVEKIIGFSVFGVSLFLLYLISTLFHSLAFTKAKNVFLIFDRSAIFLLIAGTYTPLLLLALNGIISWLLLGVIWMIAVTGIVLNAVFQEKIAFVYVPVYILMGWIGLGIFQLMSNNVSGLVLWLLVLGGIFYTLGTIFYAWTRLPFSHMIWHLFVIAGSVCHFLMVLHL